MESKKSYLSKTLIFNAIVAISALVVPGVSEFVGKHPTEAMLVLSAIGGWLRVKTSGKVELW